MTTAQFIEPTSTAHNVSSAATGAKPRLDSIDILRGLVIIFMALDHTKGHFWKAGFDPLNPDVTTLGAYMTRWITHFCAPTFCFLMGTGAYLAGRRGKTPLQLFWFLFSRGVWLLILEFTIVKYGMFLQFDLHNWAGIVYWSLGSCLVFLSLMVFFPPRVVAAIGLVMILGHNLFDGVKADSLGAFRPVWVILHQGGKVALADNINLMVAYPLIPWIGVVSVGYAFGTIYETTPERRQRIMFLIGLGLTLGFLAIHAHADRAVVLQHAQIPAITPLLDDDARARSHVPRVPRTAPDPQPPFGNYLDLRPRTPLLLGDALVRDQGSGNELGASQRALAGVHVQIWRARPRGNHVRPADGLLLDLPCCRHPLLAVQVVRRRQGA